MKHSFEMNTPKFQSPAAETPYLKAKQVWDERIATFALSADQWRKIAIISASFALVVLILLMISMSWHKPQLYVAEVSPAGQVMNVKLLSENYQPSEAQEEYFITQFIKLLRNMPLDPVATKNNWLSAYQLLSNRGTQVLNDYFQKNNPLASLGKQSITTNITDINPLSANSFQVDWIEESVDQNGQLLGQTPMSGVFTVAIQPPKNKQDMLQNPLGIYIVDFHMSPRISTH